MLNGLYSLTDLESLWTKAGGNPASAHRAASVALAESNGDPNATGHNTNGTIDRGLWQVNSVHGAQSTTNPLANAQAAVSISGNGANWNPWTTFKNGAYKQFERLSQYQPLPKGTGPNTPFSKVDPNADAGGVGGGIGGLTGAGGIGDLVSTVGNAFNQTIKDAKYAAVLVGALIVAAVLITHATRGDGPTHRPVPIPVPV